MQLTSNVMLCSCNGFLNAKHIGLMLPFKRRIMFQWLNKGHPIPIIYSKIHNIYLVWDGRENWLLNSKPHLKFLNESFWRLLISFIRFRFANPITCRAAWCATILLNLLDFRFNFCAFHINKTPRPLRNPSSESCCVEWILSRDNMKQNIWNTASCSKMWDPSLPLGVVYRG